MPPGRYQRQGLRLEAKPVRQQCSLDLLTRRDGDEDMGGLEVQVMRLRWQAVVLAQDPIASLRHQGKKQQVRWSTARVQVRIGRRRCAPGGRILPLVQALVLVMA